MQEEYMRLMRQADDITEDNRQREMALISQYLELYKRYYIALKGAQEELCVETHSRLNTVFNLSIGLVVILRNGNTRQ